MKRTGSQNTRGFTVMELVIVLAIIGVLLAISAPLVGTWVDQSRRSHDIGCVEAAVAAAKAEFAYDYDGEDETTRIYTFNAASGEATPAKTAAGYGQWDQAADYEVDGKAVGGVAKDSFVTCGIKAGQVTILHWGEHYTWESVVSDIGSSTSNNWTENTALRESVQAIDNDERIEVDRHIVKSLADYFVGKTSERIQSELGGKYNSATSDRALLFHYRIDKNSNSIRLGYPAPGPGYLASLGYPTTTTSGTAITDTINNYMTRYLFVSDEMIQSGVEHSVNIRLTIENGVCTACRVWVKDVDWLDSNTIDN